MFSCLLLFWFLCLFWYGVGVTNWMYDYLAFMKRELGIIKKILQPVQANMIFLPAERADFPSQLSGLFLPLNWILIGPMWD